jgi:hypothetical protein
MDSMLTLPDGFKAREEWLDQVSGGTLTNSGGAVHAKLLPSQGIIIVREI